MKTLIFYLFLTTGMVASAQVSVSTGGSQSGNSAMPDAKSATWGMLILRMTTAARDASAKQVKGYLNIC